MNRRYFIKTVCTLLGATAIPKPILEAFVKGQKPSELIWFSKNFSWIFKSVHENKEKILKEHMIDFDGFQLFVTRYNLYEINSLNTTVKDPKDVHRYWLYDHVYYLCLHIIFGKYKNDEEKAERYMSGYLEKYGRLPTKNDKIIVEYINFLEKIMYTDRNIIRTELKLK